MMPVTFGSVVPPESVAVSLIVVPAAPTTTDPPASTPSMSVTTVGLSFETSTISLASPQVPATGLLPLRSPL